MKFFTTKQAWIWAFASLLIINIAVIGTMMLQRSDDLKRKGYYPTEKEITDTRPDRMGYGKWREKMGFTAEQDEKLKMLRREFRETTSGIFSSLQENQQKTFKEMARDVPDHNKLAQLAEQSGMLHASLRKATIEHMLAIKAITTDEQYEKMAEMMQQWMFPQRMGPQQRIQHRRSHDHNDTCRDGKK